MGDVTKKAHGSHQSERANVCVWQGFVEASRGRQDRSASCNDVIYEDQALRRPCQGHRNRQRLNMLPNRRAIAAQSGRGFTDRVAATKTGPNRLTQSDTIQCGRQSFGSPNSRM
jgi:hypothetical protein